MATVKQLRANRLNALKSAGPCSVEGKARAAANALKSGIHAAAEILPWEDAAEREALRDEYHAFHQPQTPEERALVDSLVHGEFLMRRFRRAETRILAATFAPGASPADDVAVGRAYLAAGPELARLQRRLDAVHRAFHHDLDQFRLLVAERPEPEPAIDSTQPVASAEVVETPAPAAEAPAALSAEPPDTLSPEEFDRLRQVAVQNQVLGRLVGNFVEYPRRDFSTVQAKDGKCKTQ